MRHRHLFLLAACLVLGALVVVGSPTTTIAAPTPRVGALDWSPCFLEEARDARRASGDTTVRFQCATLRVPLDHDEPGGQKIDIAVVRLPARNGAGNISLMVNPGGPGGSGVDMVVGAGAFIYNDAIRNRFDIVGFDPRGIARSEGLRCFRKPGGFFQPYPGLPYPETTRELKAWKAADQAVADACGDKNPRILAHMSTANVARDMDLLREAVGDERLTYQGFSYGTYLGVTYANLFPDKVRAIVVDGVLDPVAWSANGARGSKTIDQRLGSSTSANATLKEFFRLCTDAGPQRCAIAPNPKARWNALLEYARETPIVYTVGQGSNQATYRETDRTIISSALGAMYNSGSWSRFAEFLAFLEQQAAGGRTPSTTPTAAAPFPEDVSYPGGEGFAGVFCGETRNPSRFDAWTNHANRAAEPFGRVWTWGTSLCVFWPTMDEDRYTGPYDTATSTPLLVASTTHDPSTPYTGALAVKRISPDAVLVTVEGWGHTMYGLSRCGDQIVNNYIVSGEIPGRDRTCPQNVNPFPRQRVGGVSARDRLVAELRAADGIG